MKKIINYTLMFSFLYFIVVEGITASNQSSKINNLKKVNSEVHARTILKDKTYRKLFKHQQTENIIFKNLLCLSGYPCPKDKTFYQEHIILLLRQSPLINTNFFHYTLFFGLSFLLFNALNLLTPKGIQKNQIVKEALSSQEDKGVEKKAA